jgi:hypothetical protein
MIHCPPSDARARSRTTATGQWADRANADAVDPSSTERLRPVQPTQAIAAEREAWASIEAGSPRRISISIFTGFPVASTAVHAACATCSARA